MDIKNPSFIGALGFVALVLGLTGWYMATHPAPVAPIVEEEPSALESETPKNMRENSKYYTIDITYPTHISFPLSSRSDAGVGAENTMKTWVDSAVTEFKAYAKENEAAIEDFANRGDEIPATLSSSELSITYGKKSSDRTITYVFTSASYTGGAHGIAVPVTFTFDKTTGVQIELADLFTAGSGYLYRLSEISRADLPKIMGGFSESGFIAEGTMPRDVHFQAFYLEGDTLTFLFAPYQVGPYSLGTVTLPIKLSRLNDILRPEYRSE